MASRFYLSVTWKSSLCEQLLYPATLKSEWVSSRGTPGPYGVVSHRCVPFLILYTRSAHYINIVHLHVHVHVQVHVHVHVSVQYAIVFKVRSHDRFRYVYVIGCRSRDQQ